MIRQCDEARLWTIGQAARALGVAASTLRFWESQGLVRPAQRTASGYRLYGPEQLERLRFVRAAQQVGFRLEDIRTLLALDGDCPACRAEVRRLLEARLAAIEAKLAELKRVRAILGRALARCRRSSSGCAVLQTLRPDSEGVRR